MEVKATVTAMTETVLFFTDTPELLVARDEFGTAYLCLLVQLDEAQLRFIATKISSQRLSDLRSGKMDLRNALLFPERQSYFEGVIPPGERVAITLEPIERVPEEWLPREGFFLNKLDDAVADDSAVVRQAVETNSAVIVCRFDPLEARGLSSRVDADKLAGAIRKFQFLVRQSAKSVLAARGGGGKKTAAGFDDATELQVVAFSPGSFNVHFESKESANLFGDSVIGGAMQRVDALMQLAERPVEQIAEALPAQKGAVLAAYHDLLKFVGKYDLPFAYQWADPAFKSSHSRRISVESASAIVAIIEQERTLLIEEKAFTGRFTSVQTDRAPFSWTARDGNDGKHYGTTHEAAPDVLSGVTIKAQQYTFVCEQRLVTTPSGDPVHKLFLKSAHPLTAV